MTSQVRRAVGQRPGKVVADAHLSTCFTHVLMARAATSAGPATEHRVAGHPSADPVALDAVADRRDRAHPFVTEAHRETRVTVVQVGHVAPEEIDVGATHANPLDINDDRPPRQRGMSSRTSTAKGAVTTKARIRLTGFVGTRLVEPGEFNASSMIIGHYHGCTTSTIAGWIVTSSTSSCSGVR